MLLAFVRTYYGFTAQLFKEGEAHIGKRRFSVHACFLLHYGNKVVESIVLFLRNGDFFLYLFIILNQLRCGKSHRKPCRPYIRLKQCCS